MRYGIIFVALAIFVARTALAQGTVAIAIEGWAQEEKGGTTYFRCASAICAKGSVVSFRRQPHRPNLPFAAFEQHHRRLSATATEGTDSRVTQASVHDFQERTIDGARVLVAFRDVSWKSGAQTSHVDALVIGKGGTFSVVSDAGRVEWASNNFSGFLPRIIDLAMLEPPKK